MTITLTEFEAMDLRLALASAAATLLHLRGDREFPSVDKTAQECRDLYELLMARSEESRGLVAASSLEGRE